MTIVTMAAMQEAFNEIAKLYATLADCRAKSAERLAVIESLVSAIGAGDYSSNVSMSPELWARVQKARSDQ